MVGKGTNLIFSHRHCNERTGRSTLIPGDGLTRLKHPTIEATVDLVSAICSSTAARSPKTNPHIPLDQQRFAKKILKGNTEKQD